MRDASRLLVALTLVLVALVGCGGDAPEPTPDPLISTESPSEALTEADYGDLDPSEVALNTFWTRNRVSNADAPDAPVRLTAVSTEALDGFDRVVFSFEGPDVPGYRVSIGTEGGGGCDGTEAGTDAPAHVAVEFTGATAGDGGAGAVELAPEVTALAEAVQTCNDGGTVRWLLGMDAETDFRIFQMRGEARLVVDLRHMG